MSASVATWLLSLCAGPAALQSQVPGGELVTLADHQGLKFNDYWGFVIAAAGDLDGDLIPDYAFSAPLDGTPARWEAGKIFVHSGADHSLLWTVTGDSEYDELGRSLASAGDVNGDGVPDLIAGGPNANAIGATNAGMARVFSGVDGSTLHTFYGTRRAGHLGTAVASPGDLDSDGYSDLLVGMPHVFLTGEPGRVIAISGRDGSPLLVVDGPDGNDFGASIAPLGDWNHDGTPDFLVGAPGAYINGVFGLGAVYVISGASGGVLHRWTGEFAGTDFGLTVARAGDHDGDGIPDALVGAPDYTWSFYELGKVYLYGSATGGLIAKFGDGLTGKDEFGAALDGGSDWDGDGVPDIAIGNPWGDLPGSYNDGWVAVYSGEDFRMIHAIAPGPLDSLWGETVCFVGDLDGDGRSELGIGSPGTDAPPESRVGSAEILHYDRYLETDETVMSIASGGEVRIALRFPPGSAGAAYRVVASLAGVGNTNLGVEVPILPDALTQSLGHCREPQLGNWVRFCGDLDAAAEANARLIFAAGEIPGSAIGRTLVLAAVTWSGGAATLSSAPVFLRFEP